MSIFLNSLFKKIRGNFVHLGRRFDSGEKPCKVCTDKKPKKNKGKGHEPHFITNPIFSLPLFTWEFINKHYEILPLVIIAFGGISLTSMYGIRNLFTRDDVRWRSKGKFACEAEPNFDNPPVRKMIVINQKYKFSEGLRKALREPEEE